MWQAHALLSLPTLLGGCAGKFTATNKCAPRLICLSCISLPSLSMQRGAFILPGAHLAVVPRVCPTPRRVQQKHGLLARHTSWRPCVASSHCLALRSVWWMLPWAITGGPVVSLHVILQLRDSPQGKVIVYQEVLTPSALSCQCVSAAHELYSGERMMWMSNFLK